MRLKCFCTLYINIDSKWIKDIIVISETTELLEKKIGRKFSDINYSNILWICLLRKTKIKKWDLIKLKRFCTAKETAKKTKGQAAAAAAKSLQSCPTLRPQLRQPTRLPCPWDSPAKRTGVGCHCLLQRTDH